MAVKIQYVTVQDQAKLQELVVAYAELLPGRLKILDIGLPTEAGSLNLGVDQEGRLVVLLISTTMDDSLLLRAISQASWVTTHAALLNRIYGKRGVDTSRAPRAIIIGPRFSPVFQETSARFAMGLELYEYRSLIVNGEQALIFDSVMQAYTEAVAFPEQSAIRSSESAVVEPVRLTEEELSFLQNARPEVS